MTKLTPLDVAILNQLPDGLYVGLPATTVADLIGRRRDSVADRLRGFTRAGLAQREKPNEDWPFVYAITPAGRDALSPASTVIGESRTWRS